MTVTLTLTAEVIRLKLSPSELVLIPAGRDYRSGEWTGWTGRTGYHCGDEIVVRPSMAGHCAHLGVAYRVRVTRIERLTVQGLEALGETWDADGYRSHGWQAERGYRRGITERVTVEVVGTLAVDAPGGPPPQPDQYNYYARPRLVAS